MKITRPPLPLLATLLVACWMVPEWMLDERINSQYRTSFAAMMGGSADLPYVGRVLPRWLAYIFTSWVSEGFRSDLVREIAQKPSVLGGVLARTGTPPALLPELLALLGVWLVAFAAFGRGLLGLAEALYERDHPLLPWFPVLGLLSLQPLFGDDARYLYDPITLGLASLLWWALVRRRWLLYYGLFGVALLNKETFVFFAMPVAVMLWADRRDFVRHLGFHAVVFVTVRGSVARAYADHAGTMMEFHGAKHVEALLASPLSSLNFVGLLGIAWYLARPRFLRQGMWLVPPLLIAYWLGGSPGEWRVFYEVMPVVLVVLFQSLLQFTSHPLKARAPGGVDTSEVADEVARSGPPTTTTAADP